MALQPNSSKAPFQHALQVPIHQHFSKQATISARIKRTNPHLTGCIHSISQNSTYELTWE